MSEDPRFIRPYRPSDHQALVDICVETGDAGAGARGIFRDDALLGDVYAVPYAQHDPSLVFVIDDGTGRAIGYVIGAADTETFERWFHDTWWPSVRERYAGHEEFARDAAILANAERMGTVASAYTREYPAHLHIDLLPETQGGGFGRRMIDTLFDALRERGVPGVHLVAAAANTSAIGFYERLGFTRLPSDAGSAAFGMRLAGSGRVTTR